MTTCATTTETITSGITDARRRRAGVRRAARVEGQPEHRRTHGADPHADRGRELMPGAPRTAIPTAAPMNMDGNTGPPRKALSDRP